MSHYRDLNKELIDQVQKMRLDMKVCCNEIIFLKKELMEKHEIEINLRKQCYSWAVNSFAQLLQSVQPDSEIIPLLKEYVQPDERVYLEVSDVKDRRSRIMGGRISETRRSSTTLAKEMQRSNYVMNIRKSIRRTSPIRRDSKAAEDEQNSQFDQHDGEEENAEPAKNKLTESLIDNSNIIYEDFEEEEEDEEIFDVESVCESIGEHDSSQPRTTLKDVTNTLAAKPNSPQQENIVSKTDIEITRERKGRLRKLCDQENTTGSIANNKAVVEDEEETLQELRRCSKERPLVTSRSIPINQHDTAKDIEDINSPTLIYNDITIRNFKNIPCSTPNSLHNSPVNKRTQKKDEYTPDLTSTTTSIGSTTISGRPSRQCKPVNLKEPTIGSKLRNESKSESLNKRHKKNGSKSKTKK